MTRKSAPFHRNINIHKICSFFSKLLKSQTDRVLRACALAFTAADAFCIVGRFYRIYFHPAYLSAFSAVDAFMRIHFQMVNTDFIQQAVNSAERTKYAAEKTIDENAAGYRYEKYCHFQEKKAAYRLPQFRMCANKRNAAFQCACRADKLTEGRFAHAHIVGGCDRQDDDEDDEHEIFDIYKASFQFELGRRNFVDQFLYQTKRTQPAADGSSEQGAESK